MKEREEDHDDQPWAFPARARQYHRVPLLLNPVHLTLVESNSLPAITDDFGWHLFGTFSDGMPTRQVALSLLQ